MKSTILLFFAILLCACSESSVDRLTTPLGTAPATRVEQPGMGIPGRYIVVFHENIADAESHSRRLATEHSARLLHVYRSALKGMVVDMSPDDARSLSGEPTVAFVEQDQVARSANTQVGATWGLDRIDQRGLPLNGEYGYTGTGSSVSVYIIDTGINFSHNEFGGRAVSGDDEITAGGDAGDCNGHGTHVAGTVGGSEFGVAKTVHLVSVRVLDCAGTGTVSGVIAGIDWVSQHMVLPAVANLSLGAAYSAALNDAVETSIGLGVVYVVAAGNNAADACNYSPSSAPDAITIGATDRTDSFASFSNSGPCIDTNAPGVGITSAWIGSATATNTISGTSMAAPHVAGVAALYLDRDPSAAPGVVRDYIVRTSTTGQIPNLGTGTANLLVYSAPPDSSSLPAPRASFVYSCSWSTCTFDASQSMYASSYMWDFGDGKTASGLVVSHTFARRSNFTVMLTVSAAAGSDSLRKTVVCGGKKCS